MKYFGCHSIPNQTNFYNFVHNSSFKAAATGAAKVQQKQVNLSGAKNKDNVFYHFNRSSLGVR